jgi:hypothetical protein
MTVIIQVLAMIVDVVLAVKMTVLGQEMLILVGDEAWPSTI